MAADVNVAALGRAPLLPPNYWKESTRLVRAGVYQGSGWRCYTPRVSSEQVSVSTGPDQLARRSFPLRQRRLPGSRRFSMGPTRKRALVIVRVVPWLTASWWSLLCGQSIQARCHMRRVVRQQYSFAWFLIAPERPLGEIRAQEEPSSLVASFDCCCPSVCGGWFLSQDFSGGQRHQEQRNS